VKTRLAADVGAAAAAELAAAAFLDTIETCTRRFGPERCHLALAGRLADARRGADLAAALSGWSVFAQSGGALADRLAHAHREVGLRTGAPVVQLGMDTPQVTGDLLDEVVDGLRRHDAMLGPAADGGWWVLALRRPGEAAALPQVEMSTPHTGALTELALAARGLDVGSASTLRDVDTAADAALAATGAPRSRFAAEWARLVSAVSR
jgi:glycosyltransferase A (GT-A) superfamily protein (DUF2064 family)